MDTINSIIDALDDKAPINHSVSSTTYGIATNTNYGHTKLSDDINSTSSITNGVAATPKAVKTSYDLATNAVNKVTTLENNMIKITYWG